MELFSEGMALVMESQEMSEAALEAIATRVLQRMRLYYDHLLINGGKPDASFQLVSLEDELLENPLD